MTLYQKKNKISTTKKLIAELNVSKNNLQRLGKEMNEMKNLTTLNASHNKLTKAFDFGAESLLTDVDLSFNKIEDIDQASKQKSLRKLDLRSVHLFETKEKVEASWI